MNTTRLITFLSILFFAITTFGQNPYIKTSIYFATDKYELTDSGKAVIDNILLDIGKKEILKVIIKGNTDSDADSIYNLTLSNKRATSVENYILSRGIEQAKIVKDFYGENKPKATNTTDKGKKINRRVDIIITYKEIMFTNVEVKISDEKEWENIASDNCNKDTIIYLTGNVEVKIDLCEYQKNKDCIQFTAYTSPEMIRDSALVTVDEYGNGLISGGMFGFQTCNDSCLKKPITVRIPVPCNLIASMLLYERSTTGEWINPMPVAKVVKIKGVYYYEFELSCTGRYNVDKYPCKKGFVRKYKKPCYKLTFYAKDEVLFKNIAISSSCPLGFYFAKVSSNQQKATIWLKCPSQTPEIKIYAISAEGIQIETEYKSLSLIKDQKPRKKCYTLSKKYKIGMEDIQNTEINVNTRF